MNVTIPILIIIVHGKPTRAVRRVSCIDILKETFDVGEIYYVELSILYNMVVSAGHGCESVKVKP